MEVYESGGNSSYHSYHQITPPAKNPRPNSLQSPVTDPGAPIPPKTMKHLPYLRKCVRLSRKISQVTLFHVTFPQKYVFSSAKISDDLFFSHRLQISKSHISFYIP